MNKERKKQSCYKTGSDLSTIQLYGRPTFILNQSNDTNKRKIGQRNNAALLPLVQFAVSYTAQNDNN